MVATRTKNKSRAKPKRPVERTLPLHAFWSGAFSFGLVNVPGTRFSRHPALWHTPANDEP